MVFKLEQKPTLIVRFALELAVAVAVAVASKKIYFTYLPTVVVPPPPPRPTRRARGAGGLYLSSWPVAIVSRLPSETRDPKRKTTFNNGYLGSPIDDERSKVRYVM